MKVAYLECYYLQEENFLVPKQNSERATVALIWKANPLISKYYNKCTSVLYVTLIYFPCNLYLKSLPIESMGLPFSEYYLF